MQQHLQDTWMLPLCVNIQDLKDSKCDVLSSLYKYYTSLNEHFPGKPKQARLITPLFCKEWKKAALENRMQNQRAKEDLAEAWDKLQVSRGGATQEIVEKALAFHKKRLQDALTNAVSPEEWKPCFEQYQKIIKLAKALNDTPATLDIAGLFRHCHEYNALLAEHGVDTQSQQDAVHDLMVSALRYMECLRLALRTTELQVWPSLGKEFAESWHTHPSLCKFVELNKDHLESWTTKQLSPEFSVFGIGAKDLPDDINGRKDYSTVRWFLVLATDLDYPFEVGKISIVEKGDPKWDEYIDVLSSFHKNQGSNVHNAN
jgi:hypothetical protein